jgi:hypothetical protein
VYAGNKVVGMHLRHDTRKNIAVRVEAVVAGLGHENGDQVFKELRDDVKLARESVKFIEHGDDYDVVTSRGYCILDMTRREAMSSLGLDEQDREDCALFRDLAQRDKRSQVWEQGKKKAGQKLWADYEDEALIQPVTIKVVKQKKLTHMAKIPPLNEVEWPLDELKELGWEPGTFDYPKNDETTEEISLKKHLELGVSRENAAMTVTQQQVDAIAALVLERLGGAYSVYAPENWKSKLSILRVIHSTAVETHKSPGYPYVLEGMPTNADVLDHYTAAGFAELVEKKWNDPIEGRVFLKIEPHKRRKLDAGMPRVIVGLPLHYLVKCQCLFGELLRNAVEKWQQGPLKYAFNPALPGHIEHLAERYGDKPLDAGDKTNWDYNYLSWHFRVFRVVMSKLFIKPVNMDSATYEAFLDDVQYAITQVLRASYRCTNGRVYILSREFLMRSGWLLTIFANTVGQVTHDTGVLYFMGVDKHKIVDPDENKCDAGGDDTYNQNKIFVDRAQKELYLRTSLSLGVEIPGFETTMGLDQSEFYSHKLYREGNTWKYKPVRFTKHIEKLRRTPLKDLAGALGSHMRNYCWDNARFAFFEALYKTLQSKHGVDMFPMVHLKPQFCLQAQVKGFEVSC